MNEEVEKHDARIERTKRIERIEKQLRELTSRMNHNERFVGDCKKRLELFEPHAVEKMLDAITADASELHKRLQREFLKACVVSEVAYSARRDYGDKRSEVQSACLWALWAFDHYDDRFWEGLSDISIRDAREKLLHAYRNRVIG